MPVKTSDHAEPQQVQTLVLPKNFEISAEMQTAINAVSAGKSIFITGRAGTGKSTLLTYLREEELNSAPSSLKGSNIYSDLLVLIDQAKVILEKSRKNSIS